MVTPGGTMKSDLHLHSRFSDGTEWPAAVVSRARAVGLRRVALTDHDSMEGVHSFLEACRSEGLEGVAGTEIDVVSPEVNYDSELLGYYPGGRWDKTRAFLREQLRARESVVRANLEEARVHFGVSGLALDEIRARKRGDDASSPEGPLFSFSRVDVFLYLAHKGVIDGTLGYPDFKKRYFKDRTVFTKRTGKPTLREAAEVILRDGGFPVLPHPGHVFHDEPEVLTERREELLDLLKHARSAGVWGVELYWYKNPARTEAVNGTVREVGERAGLHFTYGTDHHGAGSRNDNLGAFSGDFPGFPDRLPAEPGV
jgi:predicted metal-dependent phosphoesterase TrpH